MTFHILGTIFLTDEPILFKGIETTNQIINYYIPVVPHKAVAEVSKIGNL